MPRIAAIVLAAGGSSRMGRPKQLLKLQDQTLVRRATLSAIGAGCAPVCVVVGTDAAAISADLSGLSVTISINPHWQDGIGTSLRQGLATITDIAPPVDAVAILLADQPHLSQPVLTNLLTRWQTAARPIAASQYAATLGPPCCLARTVFPAIAALPDNAGAKRLLESAARDQIEIVDWPDGAVDVDTPQDWQNAIAAESAPAPSPPAHEQRQTQ